MSPVAEIVTICRSNNTTSHRFLEIVFCAKTQVPSKSSLKNMPSGINYIIGNWCKQRATLWATMLGRPDTPGTSCSILQQKPCRQAQGKSACDRVAYNNFGLQVRWGLHGELPAKLSCTGAPLAVGCAEPTHTYDDTTSMRPVAHSTGQQLKCSRSFLHRTSL